MKPHIDRQAKRFASPWRIDSELGGVRPEWRLVFANHLEADTSIASPISSCAADSFTLPSWGSAVPGRQGQELLLAYSHILKELLCGLYVLNLCELAFPPLRIRLLAEKLRRKVFTAKDTKRADKERA